jgi:hypothetical protein
MRNFRLVKDNVDVRPFLAEIARVPNAWDMSTGRQDKIAVQREAKAIPLRGLVKSKIAGRKRWDVHESRYTTSARKFPFICGFLESFAAEQDGELSRAKLVCLPPGHRIYPHIDRGEYYKVRDRYHLILQSPLGSYLTSGDETNRMREGELWWFDNKLTHEAFNDSELDRIHFIFDLLPRSRVAEVFGDDRAA